jgi:hypothetical protein
VNKIKKNDLQVQQTHINAEQRGEKNTSPSLVNHSTVPSKGTHVKFYQAQEMIDWILLDNQSTDSVFCNQKYLHDVKESDEALILSTHGGDPNKIDRKCAWISKKSVV